MTQVWAIVRPSGEFTIHYTQDADQHLADCGHADECDGNKVYALEREPDTAHGEGVDPDTGAITFIGGFELERLVSEIKVQAARQIEAISPLWKQQNDTRQPSPEGDARFAAIDAVRDWSNEIEGRARKAVSADELRALRIEIGQ